MKKIMNVNKIIVYIIIVMVLVVVIEFCMYV